VSTTYRKKPVEVQAMPVREAFVYARVEWHRLPKWLADAYDTGEVMFLHHPDRITIKTLEGTMTANIDDWLIQGVQGELYPCKPDIFEATYEPVGGAQ
jgi:hypothetical protein